MSRAVWSFFRYHVGAGEGSGNRGRVVELLLSRPGEHVMNVDVSVEFVPYFKARSETVIM